MRLQQTLFTSQLGHTSATGLRPQPERLATIALNQNPYVSGVPLAANSPVFLGRQAILHQILSVLRRPDKPGCVSLVGERRIGKSSLLNQVRVALAAAPGLITLYGNAQEWRGATPATFYTCLGHAIDTALGVMATDPAESFSTFRDKLKALATTHDIRCVLIIDEFDAMANTPAFDADFFTQLRALVSEQDYRLGIATASLSSLHEMRNIHSIDSSAFWNVFGFKQVLGLFKPEEALSLLTLPMGRSLPNKQPPDFNALWARYFAPISGCHPAFIQMIAENLWAAIEYDESVDELHLEQGALDYFQDFLQHRTTAERQVLLQIAHNEAVERNHTVTDLIQRGLLTADATPFSALFQRAILADAGRIHGRTTPVAAQVNVSALDRITIRGFYTLQTITLSDLKDKREIYILGENGDGKTLLLQAILLLFRQHFIRHQSEKGLTGPILQLLDENPELFLQGTDASAEQFGGEQNITADNVFAYGVHRSRTGERKQVNDYGFLTLFKADAVLNNPATWLAQMASSPSAFAVPLASVVELLTAVLGGNIGITTQPNSPVRFTEKGAPIAFERLSEGFKSVMVWVSDLCLKLSAAQPTITRFEDFTGIVLLDEVELHLHPKWEYAFMAQLRHHFKQVQFILSTHSPTVIRGASRDAVVYRMYREHDDNTNRIVSKLSEPYAVHERTHWMANSVVTSPLFDLPHARMAAFDPAKHSLDTEDDFWYLKIHETIAAQVKQMRASGQVHISTQAIDTMVLNAINQYRTKS